MSKWKLCRQTFGNEEFELNEGKTTIGRGGNNTIKLTSVVISRNHCFVRVHQNEVFITDLQSANGVFVGPRKIAPKIPHILNNHDIIGLGWTTNHINIDNNDKHIYQLVKHVDGESNLKRKSGINDFNPVIEIIEHGAESENYSDANSGEINNILESKAKKVKLEPKIIDLSEDENEDLQYEAFKTKQEYVTNDEPELILSDSDFESENLFARLSQNSPREPVVKIERPDVSEVNNSYSQQEDDISNVLDDIENEAEIPEYPENTPKEPDLKKLDVNNQISNHQKHMSVDFKDVTDPVICKSPSPKTNLPSLDQFLNSSNTAIRNSQIQTTNKDGDNEKHAHHSEKVAVKSTTVTTIANKEPVKKNQIGKSKPKSQSRLIRRESCSSKKTVLPSSQKEKRRQKLKDICQKEKSIVTESNSNSRTNDKNNKNKLEPVVTASQQENDYRTENKDNNTGKVYPPPRNTIQIIEAHIMPTGKKRVARNKNVVSENGDRLHLQNNGGGKKINKDKTSKKTVNSVHFNDQLTQVREFEIENYNKLKSVKMAKRLIDVPNIRLSRKKRVIMKILAWNPQWFDEQKRNKEPPPILSDNNELLTLLLFFSGYKQYVRKMENLLLIELWEYLTQENNANNKNYLHLQIETLPPKPPRDRYSELYTITVKISVSTPASKQHIPRDGDIVMLKLMDHNSENGCRLKFSYIYNVIHISSPPNTKTVILSCNVTYSSLFERLKSGDALGGCIIANINRQLSIFEAIERLENSPLRDFILKPEPSQCEDNHRDGTFSMASQWTATLNSSQQRAVSESVRAALGQTPALRMIQGPPGTGKSSVICAIVMSYFYGNSKKKQSKRGKLLICATSNAAVDELVNRLLSMRESLESEDRFRLVRVGRLESMQGRARDVSSQQLAQRDHGRRDNSSTNIALYEAQLNRWKTERKDDPVRAAYCEERAKYCERQIKLLRGGECSPRDLIAAERRVVENADIVATTLASAVNHKMQGLKGIELCIVDEAGQAIEPETLLPLLLEVTKMTLVGDPQQLPGYVFSQRAKDFGLDRSLFSRLSSCSECWDRRPLVLLDQQYRMHPVIADYPNRAFYGGRVRSVAITRPELNLPPYCILDVGDWTGDRQESNSEAWGAARVSLAVCMVARSHRPRLSVAVITPYAAHRELIKKCLLELDESNRKLEVNTVDSFQGQERDMIVVSLGRSHGVGFLSNAGRMNVLLTRARHVMIMVLDRRAVQEHDQWRTLVEDAKAKRNYKILPPHMCQPASCTQITSTEVLEYLNTT